MDSHAKLYVIHVNDEAVNDRAWNEMVCDILDVRLTQYIMCCVQFAPFVFRWVFAIRHQYFTSAKFAIYYYYYFVPNNLVFDARAEGEHWAKRIIHSCSCSTQFHSTHSHTHYCTRKAFMGVSTMDSASVSERNANDATNKRTNVKSSNLTIAKFRGCSNITSRYMRARPFRRFHSFASRYTISVFAQIFLFPTVLQVWWYGRREPNAKFHHFQSFSCIVRSTGSQYRQFLSLKIFFGRSFEPIFFL